jgi:hypothetical protein
MKDEPIVFTLTWNAIGFHSENYKTVEDGICKLVRSPRAQKLQMGGNLDVKVTREARAVPGMSWKRRSQCRQQNHICGKYSISISSAQALSFERHPTNLGSWFDHFDHFLPEAFSMPWPTTCNQVT